MDTTEKRLDTSIIIEEEAVAVDLEAIDINNVYYNEVLADTKTSFDIDDEEYAVLENLLEYYRYEDELHNKAMVKKEA